MKRILLTLVLIAMCTITVNAQDLTAPPVPEYAQKFMPDTHENFANGLLEVIRDVLLYIHPDLKEAGSVCVSIICIVMVTSILKTFSGMSEATVALVGCMGISLILLKSAGSLINLASTTVQQISEYGKLLLPVMTAALAGQGGIGTSTALYAGTAFFDAVLASIISNILTPAVYLFLFLSIGCSAIREDVLKKIRDGLMWALTWSLKIILYIYTGYIGITGVVSGVTDAAALKAAKLTISSAVPIVGGILSDASEAVLISASAIKNAAGIYGFLAIFAIWIGPFMQIGSHYLLLKATGGICSTFASKSSTMLIQDFSSALGLLLAMTGTNCLLFLISMVCFLRGVG